MFSRRLFTVLAIVLALVILYFLFEPLGIIWFLRTGGWDKWSKLIPGQVADDGSVLFPVILNWDFVDLSVAPKSSDPCVQDEEIRIQVINPLGQSLSVRCGRKNADDTGVKRDTLIHKVTTDKIIDVYEGSLTELQSHWIPIRVERADGGSSLDFQLRITAKTGRYKQKTVPFTLEARWWSYGL